MDDEGFYVVLDDGETFTTDGFIVLKKDMSAEEIEIAEDCEGSVFSGGKFRKIWISSLIRTLKRAGLWEDLIEEV